MDVLGLDRAIGSAARALEKERASPEADLGRVWVAHRDVARKSLYDELAAADVPREMKPVLLAWVATLTVARVTSSAEQALARAMTDVRVPLRVEPPRLISWREGWSLLARSRDRGQARAALSSLTSLAPGLAPLVRELLAARHEALSRLEGGASLLGARDDEMATRLARRTLDATGDLARDVLRRARKKEPEPWPLALDVLLAADASEGWPARPSRRWLEDLFGAHMGGLSLELPPLPTPAGAASFTRAMGGLGGAYRRAIAGPSSVARPPRFVDVHCFGAAFAALGASPVFHRRKLGLSRRVADAHARSLAASLLVSLRLECGAWLERVGAIEMPELGMLVFGAELPTELQGAWPPARDDGPTRLLGWLGAEGMTRRLEDQHDEDWFDNPRAWADLRASPPPVTLEDESPARVARAFEARLS